jgi:hypothetical protein
MSGDGTTREREKRGTLTKVGLLQEAIKLSSARTGSFGSGDEEYRGLEPIVKKKLWKSAKIMTG